MDTRKMRIALFEQTAQVTREYLQEEVAEACRKQWILWEEDPLPPPAQVTREGQLRLTRKKTVEAAAPHARAGKRVCILNFASSVNPGGGVEQGAQAQEESICRVSTLYFALSHPTAREFYARHWEKIRAGEMNRKNTDDLIYTPGVIALRDDGKGEVLLPRQDWYAMDVITCAAPDLRQMPFDRSCYTPEPAELRAVLKNRWRRILGAAASGGAQVLILGAFGCGVFACPPALVAEAFGAVVEEYRRFFEIIEFAVPTPDGNTPNYKAFRVLPGIREER